MGVPAEQSTGAVGQRLKPAGLVGVRSPRRRRPTGAPPLLPYHVETTGVGWLAASVVLVALTIVVFARGTQGLAVSVTATDDTIVRWLTELHAPGLTAVLQGLAGVGSWVTITLVWAGLVVALLVLRRFRHLIVVVVGTELVIALAIVGIGSVVQRPRPFGVDMQTSWGGWSMPSVQISALAATLVAVLYTLVPAGRGRTVGKWAAAGLVAVVGVARMALGADAPTRRSGGSGDGGDHSAARLPLVHA